MQKYTSSQIELMIVQAKRQKQMIEELVSDFERKGGFEEEDLQYFDGILKRMEANLKALRKNCERQKGAGFPIRFL